MRARWTALAAAAVALSAIAACSEADEDPLGFDAAFYETPPLPPGGKPGDLLRSEQVEGVEGQGTTSYRVLYRSESLGGEPIAVSGVVAVPDGEPPDGGWPVLSLAHGTVGLADECAPSRWLETVSSGEIARQGFVVVATDYEGLGTEGRHPYLVGESEARGVIDAVRAARAMGAAVSASNRYVVVGYSQGGHAALFANQIARLWAPELELVGTVAGAPVVEVEPWLAFLQESEYEVIGAMLIAGLEAVDPAADPAAVLTPAALDRLSVVDDECTADVTEAFSDVGPTVFSADPTTVEPFASLIRANTPARAAGASPLLVITAADDELIPASLVDAAVAKLCALGQTVERETVPDVGHGGVLTASFGTALSWLQDRVDGLPAGSVC